MKAVLAALLFLAPLPSVSADPFVVIVRHAEKGTNSDKDPDLSPAGVARAEILGSMLKDSGIKAVFATEFKRTQQTAAVVGKSIGITPTVVPADATEQLASKLRELNGNALVVGHGNTIPYLIKALGIDSSVDITENDYSQIFVVTLGAKPQLFRFSYPNDSIRFNGQSSPAK
jgi:broad specificity phosphatase PhoE